MTIKDLQRLVESQPDYSNPKQLQQLERLEEYAKCMLGMKRNLRQTLEIADTVSDPRTKLQARAIATDIYKYIMDLVTNGVVITDAMKYVI